MSPEEYNIVQSDHRTLRFCRIRTWYFILATSLLIVLREFVYPRWNAGTNHSLKNNRYQHFFNE